MDLFLNHLKYLLEKLKKMVEYYNTAMATKVSCDRNNFKEGIDMLNLFSTYQYKSSTFGAYGVTFQTLKCSLLSSNFAVTFKTLTLLFGTLILF